MTIATTVTTVKEEAMEAQADTVEEETMTTAEAKVDTVEDRVEDTAVAGTMTATEASKAAATEVVMAGLTEDEGTTMTATAVVDRVEVVTADSSRAQVTVEARVAAMGEMTMTAPATEEIMAAAVDRVDMEDAMMTAPAMEGATAAVVDRADTEDGTTIAPAVDMVVAATVVATKVASMVVVVAATGAMLATNSASAAASKEAVTGTPLARATAGAVPTVVAATTSLVLLNTLHSTLATLVTPTCSLPSWAHWATRSMITTTLMRKMPLSSTRICTVVEALPTQPTTTRWAAPPLCRP